LILPFIQVNHLKKKLNFLKIQKKNYTFRAFKSHFFPPKLPFRRDIKYIIGIRDPVDVVSSFKAFFHQHTIEFHNLWGEFPPRDWDEKQYSHFILEDVGDGKAGFLKNFIYDYLVGWWPLRKEPNVLFVHYEDRVKDLSFDIDRISKFLGISLTPAQKERVVEHSGFKWMKNNNIKFSGKHLYDGAKERGIVPKTFPGLLEDEGMVAKGSNRDGDGLSLEFKMKIEEVLLSLLGKELYNWCRTGGLVLPSVELPIIK